MKIKKGGILSALLSIALLLLLAANFFFPDKDVAKIKKKDQTLKKELRQKQKSSTDESLEMASEHIGFSVLPLNTTAIEFKYFEGTIQWWMSPDPGMVLSGAPIDFSPLGDPIRIFESKTTLEVPRGACALMRKSTGQRNYGMRIIAPSY